MTTRFPLVQLSVVMPAYNEERSIETTVRRAVDTLRRMVGAFEILIVDDCSQDQTGTIADRLAVDLPEVRVLHNERTLGQGGGLFRGFRAARYPLVTHNAMDYPFDFEDLPALLGCFPEADVVVASRKAYPGISRFRLLASDVNRLLLRSFFGIRIADYNFVQVYRTELAQNPMAFSTATAFTTPELIVRAHHAGRRIVEIPVPYHARKAGRSSSLSWRNVRQALRDMGKLWLDLKRGH